MIERLSRAADRFSTNLEYDKTWWLLAFSTAYLIITLLNAAVKPMWFDEFFTFYISQLPRAEDIWSVLARGMEAHPPLHYFLTRASHTILGFGHVATRMPEILGFFTMCLCLFAFLARRIPAVYAAAGMVFPLITGFYQYAFEARPYAIVLGCSGIALVAWQGATEGHYRKLSLAALTLSLAAALSSHYYGVLVIVVIALGELAKCLATKRLDAPIWISMAASGIPGLFYLPLIGSANSAFLSTVAASPDFWSKPTVSRLMDFYPAALAPALGPIVIFLAGAAIAIVASPADKARPGSVLKRPPLHEIVAAIGFVAIPIFVAILATLSTGYFMDRYAIAAIVGCSILFSFFAHEFGRGRGDAGAALLALLFGWFVISEVSTKFQYRENRGPAEIDIWNPTKVEPVLPIAIANPLKFIQLSYYGPTDISSKLVYLSDPPTAVKYPDFVPELALLSLKNWASVSVQDYAKFVESQREFWVYYSSYPQAEWLITKLAQDGKKIELRFQNGPDLLFHVSEGRSVGLDLK